MSAPRFKNVLGGALARLVRRPALTADQLVALTPRRILLVRQQNQMGDMVCATPTFRAVREAFPGARIALVTAPVIVEVVRHNPHLDEIFTFDKTAWRRPWALGRFIRSIRNFGPDLAFVLGSVSFSVTSAYIALVSNARWVVGVDSLPFGSDISRQAFSLEMPCSPELDRHAVDHRLAPLASVGITTNDRTTVVVPAAKEEAEADRILADLGLERGFWALHPGAGKLQNIWPADRFGAIAARAVQAGRQVLVLHGPADGPAVEKLTPFLAELPSGSAKLAPPCPVGVGAALLGRADRFLCNDTGVMHVAGAMGVPTVALFGPTDPTFWKPPGPAVVAVTSDGQEPDPRGHEFGWMENIAEETVWFALKGLASRS
jgi:heptosyltransferase-2